MTEKRSDYRKRQSRRKASKFLGRVKSAFDDNEEHETVDVNPEFQRDESERRSFQDDGQPTLNTNDFEQKPRVDKALRLKKRLNRAILIVLVLIILVLIALFHL